MRRYKNLTFGKNLDSRLGLKKISSLSLQKYATDIYVV